MNFLCYNIFLIDKQQTHSYFQLNDSLQFSKSLIKNHKVCVRQLILDSGNKFITKDFFAKLKSFFAYMLIF